MATAYHMEALRKQRILERKQEAAMRMAAQEQGVPVTDMSASNIANAGTTIQPDYANMSAARHCENHRTIANMDAAEDCLVMGDIVHDPNFNYRIHPDKTTAPVHVNPIYRVMYPNTVSDRR